MQTRPKSNISCSVCGRCPRWRQLSVNQRVGACVCVTPSHTRRAQKAPCKTRHHKLFHRCVQKSAQRINPLVACDPAVFLLYCAERLKPPPYFLEIILVFVCRVFLQKFFVNKLLLKPQSFVVRNYAEAYRAHRLTLRFKFSKLEK